MLIITINLLTTPSYFTQNNNNNNNKFKPIIMTLFFQEKKKEKGKVIKKLNSKENALNVEKPKEMRREQSSGGVNFIQ